MVENKYQNFDHQSRRGDRIKVFFRGKNCGEEEERSIYRRTSRNNCSNGVQLFFCIVCYTVCVRRLLLLGLVGLIVLASRKS